MKYLIYILLSAFLFTGCFTAKPQLVSSATILIKTPSMKFYDKGFIFKYDDYTQVQIFSAGTAVLDMKIYNDVENIPTKFQKITVRSRATGRRRCPSCVCARAACSDGTRT